MKRFAAVLVNHLGELAVPSTARCGTVGRVISRGPVRPAATRGAHADREENLAGSPRSQRFPPRFFGATKLSPRALPGERKFAKHPRRRRDERTPRRPRAPQRGPARAAPARYFWAVGESGALGREPA